MKKMIYSIFPLLLVKHFVITTFINGEHLSPESLFTILAPKFIQPNSKYNVAVFTEDLKENIVIYLKISCGPLHHSTVEQEISMEKADTIEIDTEELRSETCSLSVKVKRKEAVWNSTTDLYNHKKIIYVASKSASILIQLEKPIYKAGETVKYRILFLNRQLLPASAEGAQIKILDSKSNIIRLYKNESILKGLFSGEMKLSSEPNTGEWEICAKLEDEEENISFSVVQHVEPQFKVEIKLPPFIVNRTSNIVAEVKAKNSHGKDIQGYVTIRLKTSSDNNLNYNINSKSTKQLSERFTQRPQLIKFPSTTPSASITQVTMPINGSVFIDLQIPEDVRIMTNKTDNIYTIEASVTESYTGIEEKATGKVQMFDSLYKIEMIECPKYYQPGFTLNFTFKVTRQDDTPISDDRPDAFELSHGFAYNDNDSIFKSSIPATGIVRFSAITPSNENLIVKSMTASYKEIKKTFLVPDKISSATKSYVSVAIEGDRVNVKANKHMKSINYLAVSQGQIVASGREEFATEKTEASITLNIKKENLRGPKVTVVVFAVMGTDNEIVFDSTDYVVEMKLENNLNIRFSKEKIEPGDNVAISLETNSKSIIALRAVDLSLNLLKGDRNIDYNRIEEFMEDFNEETIPMERSGAPLASRIFNDVGIVIFTNCYLEEPPIEPVSSPLDMKTMTKIDRLVSGVGSSPKIQTMTSKVQKGRMTNDQLVRDNFPESWIWETIDSTNTTVEIIKTVPNTLKSWVLTGFALNPESGIGVSLTPQVIETFRPFFISFRLPYSVNVGSIFSLKVILHNYMNEEISGVVVFKNSKREFRFVESVHENDDIKTSLEKRFKVPALQTSFITFTIKFLNKGEIKLELEAKSNIAGDIVSKFLKVIPQGIKQTQNRVVLLDLKPGHSQEISLSAIFPSEREANTDSLKFSLIGDLLGSSIINLDKLIELPLGCGEQSMINFVPNIVILDYLKSTGKLTAAVKERVTSFLQVAYQRELTYRNDDGSFSAFKNSESPGSTWLTAFVLRSFVSAKKYITIDEKTVTTALEYLAKSQMPNGMFLEKGHTFRVEIESRANSGISLTAFVLFAFLETKKRKTSFKYNSVVRKAIEYLSYQIIDLEDPYATTLIAYAFHLANHHNKDYAFKRVKRFSKHNNQHQYTYWTYGETENKANNKIPELDLTNISVSSNISRSKEEERPTSVEMTSYALLIYLLRHKVSDSFPIVKWLLAQRNPNGGFLSTQDTQVALTALARFAIMTQPPINFKLFASLEYPNGVKSFNITKENEMVLQEFILPSETRDVAINASGKGMALAQLTWNYFISNSSQNSSFNVEIQFKQSEESPGKFVLKVCLALADGKASNMVVMEANLPSGFNFETKNLAKLQAITTIMKFEEENDHTKLNVYFSLLTKLESCVDVDAFRLYNVANIHSAPIIVYDYYDTTRKAITFYQPPPFTLCTICSVDDQMCDESLGC